MELFIYISKSAAILALFYLVYIAILRKDTFFTANRHYLVSGILAATVFPFIEFTKRVYVELPASPPSYFSESLPYPETMASTEVFSINWWQIGLLFYGMGVSVMLFLFLKQLYTLRVLLTEYPSEKKDGYTYIRIPKICAPFSFFKYIVYNPEIHCQEELTMILKHERVHGSQWHSVDILIANLMLIFQWMNPLAWLYKKGIEENLEFIADSATVQQVASVKQYQLALVKASSTIPIPSLTTNFYQSFIKKRILMLNKSTSKKINAWKLSIILPLLAMFLWSFNVKEVVEYTEKTDASAAVSQGFYSSSEDTHEAIPVGKEITPKEIASDKEPKVLSYKTAVISNEKQPVVHNRINSEEKNAQIKSKVMVQDILLTITKNTTPAELETMKTDLKSKGFSFDYSNLEFNDKKEITGISIKYKDVNGNSGNYSVSSDSPINTIIIKADGSKLSVRSTGSGDYSYSNDEDEEVVKARAQERRDRMHHRKMEMEKRRQEMEERREKMLEEMEERREEMIERNSKIHSENESIIYQGGTIKDSNKLFTRSRAHRDSSRATIFDNHNERKDRMRARRHSTIPMENLKRITKDATENDLDRLKDQFKSEGVSFSYSSIKRNGAGEITKIKVKLDNNNGSVSTSTFDNNGQPIKTVLLGSENGSTIMSSSPN
jgi:hypothetical protein